MGLLVGIYFCVFMFVTHSYPVLGQCLWSQEPNGYRECRSTPYEANCYATADFNLDECVEKNQYTYNYRIIMKVENPNEDPLFKYPEYYTELSLLDGYLVTVPKDVFKMTNLSQIKVSGNKLRIINMNDFLLLPALEYIDLSKNTIMVIDSSKTEENITSKVMRIDLSMNYIETLPDIFINRYRELEHLNMSHNLISSIDRNAFEGAVLLKTLDLSYNKLKEVENLFAQLPKLIYTNYATPKSLQKLSALMLDNNILADVNLTVFFETGVTVLSIGGNRIPCYIFTRAKYSQYSEKFERITAKVFSFKDNNVNGIACEDVQPDTKDIYLQHDNSKLSELISSLLTAVENNGKSINTLSEVVNQNKRNMEEFRESTNSKLQNMLQGIPMEGSGVAT